MDGYKVLAVCSVRIGKLNQLRPVGFAAPEIAKTPCIPTQISFLVGCPVHPRDVAIGFENLLSIVQETDPTLPVTINPLTPNPDRATLNSLRFSPNTCAPTNESCRVHLSGSFKVKHHIVLVRRYSGSGKNYFLLFLH